MKTSAQYHQEAETAREEERYSDALSLYRQALIEYQKESNYTKIIELHCGEFITFEHLFEATNDTLFLLLAGQSIKTAREISNKFDLHTLDHMISFYDGEFQIRENKPQEAITSFKMALDRYTTQEPENVVNIARYRYHLGHALCLNNELDKGIAQLKQALQEIEGGRQSLPEGTDGDYVYNVHLSGCLMTLAHDLQKTDIEQSKEYASKARALIDSDPRLTIRKKQFEKLLFAKRS